MALVAAQDWPKSNDMDSRQQRPHANSPLSADAAAQPGSGSGAPSPYAQHQLQHQQQQQPQQQSYGYPHPQWGMMNGMGMNNMGMQMGRMAPAGYFPPMQFYPQHYPQQAVGSPQHQMQQIQQGSPYGTPPQMFDPNAHQFAQWAYQQMMFSAQQAQQLSVSPVGPPSQQSAGSPTSTQQPSRSSPLPGASSPSGGDYYQNGSPFVPPPQNNTGNSNNNHTRFQAGPPSSAGGQQGNAANNYQGFHPYRRPDRGERDRDRRTHGDNTSHNSVPFRPPYAHPDAAGSTSSVNSTSSASQRSRTNSGTSGNSGSVRGAKSAPLPSASSSSSHFQQQHTHTPRAPSTSSSQGSAPRSPSSSSTGVSTTSTPTLPTTVGSTIATRPPQRPSPLSQGSTFSAAERRKSRDDSDLAAMLAGQSLDSDGPSTIGAPAGHRSSHGLKGRLRRALSFNAVSTLREEEEEEAAPKGTKKSKGKEMSTVTDTTTDGESEGFGDEGSSMATKKTKKSLRLFNARFNASTDNISLSSTVSSASVMIRKLGSMGRLARRNSLAGITSLFKDKDKNKDKDGEGEKKSKGKGSKAEASVSMVTAELDKSSDWNAPGMEGLSPAARLARQHTLKSNAEAAARAKAQAEAQAAATAAAAANASPSGSGPISSNGVPTWDRNTANRHGQQASGSGAREDGMRVVVEDDSDEDDDFPVGGFGGHQRPDGQEGGFHDDDNSGSDEDSTWHGHTQREDEEEDVTIRVGNGVGGGEAASASGHGAAEDDDDLDEPWAMNIRRSVERSRKPAKGILKNAYTYTQDTHLEAPNLPFNHARMRANSYDSVPQDKHEAGPLAHMPPLDPDHIDGLQRRTSHRSSSSSTTAKDSSTSSAGPPTLPPLSFDSGSPTSSIIQSTISTTSTTSSTITTTVSTASTIQDGKHAVFNHPNMNSSEPVLSSMQTAPPPTLTHRSVTSPVKRLAFATNLSIYDTFSSAVYDRRSEPATWSRLTPALAMKIKEELNSYKMEEMEVHSASRIHTQFFV